MHTNMFFLNLLFMYLLVVLLAQILHGIVTYLHKILVTHAYLLLTCLLIT